MQLLFGGGICCVPYSSLTRWLLGIDDTGAEGGGDLSIMAELNPPDDANDGGGWP